MTERGRKQITKTNKKEKDKNEENTTAQRIRETKNKKKKGTQRKRKGERRSHMTPSTSGGLRGIRGPEGSITPPEADGKPLEKVANSGTVRKAESLGEMVLLLLLLLRLYYYYKCQ